MLPQQNSLRRGEAHMTADERIARHRLSVLHHAQQYKNISNTCRLFGISRTVYYKWLKRFEIFGYEGLLDITPAKPNMPNKVPPDKVQAILDYVIHFPSHGPKRIANELSHQGIKISDCGVYNVLKRHGLNRKVSRLLYMQQAMGNVMVTEDYLRTVEPPKPEHIHADHPGHILSQDTFYVGTIKGIGRIYQQTGIDCYSSFGFAKVYPDKTAKSAVDFLETKVLPVYRSLGIPLDRVLTDNGKEYTTHWGSQNHEYEAMLKKHHIRHTRIKPRSPRTNGFVERLNKTLLEEFYQLAFLRKRYYSLEELQQDLDEFMIHYNFQRTHQGYRLKGRVPAEKFLNGKRRLALPQPR